MITVFRSVSHPRYFGMTHEADPRNLPSDFGPWKWVKEGLQRGWLDNLGPVDVIEAQIEANGYCIVRSENPDLI